jgi:hypothetical protein
MPRISARSVSVGEASLRPPRNRDVLGQGSRCSRCRQRMRMAPACPPRRPPAPGGRSLGADRGIRTCGDRPQPPCHCDLFLPRPAHRMLGFRRDLPVRVSQLTDQEISGGSTENADSLHVSQCGHRLKRRRSCLASRKQTLRCKARQLADDHGLRCCVPRAAGTDSSLPQSRCGRTTAMERSPDLES